VENAKAVVNSWMFTKIKSSVLEAIPEAASWRFRNEDQINAYFHILRTQLPRIGAIERLRIASSADAPNVELVHDAAEQGMQLRDYNPEQT
jgi:hypothetical protein